MIKRVNLTLFSLGGRIMNYREMKTKLVNIKKNTSNLTQKERLEEFLKIIWEHPDAISIMGNLGIIDIDSIHMLKSKGVVGTALTNAVLDAIEIKTPNSDALSLHLFGYIKPITPEDLNNYIDEVYDRVNAQIKFFDYQQDVQDGIDQMNLDEIEQFTH